MVYEVILMLDSHVLNEHVLVSMRQFVSIDIWLKAKD